MNQDLKRGHAVIERVSPQLDCARYRAKAVVGDRVEVSADIFRDSTDMLAAVIRFRGPSDAKWQEASMTLVENDRWAGFFVPTGIGTYRYTIEAWTDRYGTWARDLLTKVEAGQKVDVELEEGALLLESRVKVMPAAERKLIRAAIDAVRSSTGAGDVKGTTPRVAACLDPEVVAAMNAYSDRAGSTVHRPVLELTVDRERARFGAWYEFFPRSTGTRTKHGTFRTAAKALARIADMGFDVVYLPPIHPIGKTHRKGKNNTVKAGPGDVGVPWAIGSEAGGHKDVDPKLGTLDDFDAFVGEANRLGMEVALDYAIQCSPDHPWVKEHPDWFQHRPDGTIKYAENPPKKYQDIYPIDFDTPDRVNLWNELKGIFDHWIAHGVKAFRVDNPHTKSFAFWEWVIASIRDDHPEVIFLSEAFTRPKVMRVLAKLGFTQSYTYFTWRNAKWELTEYMTELAQSEMRHYFRPNFFANTPDILHEYLQTGGPPAFKVRLVLAALLSPSYGIYSGYELFENTPVQEGSEEYLHSEKYELKPRDFSVEPNLSSYIKRINEIRNKHHALKELTNIEFHLVDKDNLMAFSKTAPGRESILVVVNLNPFHWEEGTVALDLGPLSIGPDEPFEVHDLVTDTTYVWRGPHNYVRLDPKVEPAHIFEIRT